MVKANEVLPDDINASYQETLRLLGKSITYNRFSNEEYDPESGSTKTWWETPSFSAVVTDEKSYILSEDSRLQTGDKLLIFSQSEFTSKGNSDEAKPRAGDEITIGTETWKAELGDGDSVWSEDAANELFMVYVRKIQ